MQNATEKLVQLVANDIGIRRATFFRSPTGTIKVTRQRRATRRTKSETFLLTFGRPNYVEREFIRRCKKAGEPFPVKKVQLQHWPKKHK